MIIIDYRYSTFILPNKKSGIKWLKPVSSKGGLCVITHSVKST